MWNSALKTTNKIKTFKSPPQHCSFVFLLPDTKNEKWLYFLHQQKVYWRKKTKKKFSISFTKDQEVIKSPLHKRRIISRQLRFRDSEIKDCIAETFSSIMWNLLQLAIISSVYFASKASRIVDWSLTEKRRNRRWLRI